MEIRCPIFIQNLVLFLFINVVGIVNEFVH